MCDASQTLGFGHALLQLGDDQKTLHVVNYGAQAVTKSQRNWTSAELELAALGLAIKQFYYFLIHRKITVLTDNSAVLHLDKWKPINARQRRLIAYLQQFRISVKYVKGKDHHTADTLSRFFKI